jgi:hypothetical protein
MRIKLISIFMLICAMMPLGRVSAAPHADVIVDKISFGFPNTATFSATLSSSADITSVTLEYGTKQLTCGDVIAKAFPEFTPAPQVNVEWTWDMRQSGSLTPGASIWWRWHYVDKNGKDVVSDTQTATWIDSKHNWQTITTDFLRLHYYGIDKTVAQDLLEAGGESLTRNAQQAGLKPDAPIDIYIYSTYQDLQDAILFEASWTGGQADAASNLVIVGLAEANHEYDRNTVIHELTHVLIGHFTFSCLNDLPTWLVEGLAVFSEGQLDPSSQIQFDEAVQKNDLLTVRSLSGGFSEEYSKATLSYSESYSLVKFLTETYGQEKMTSLLATMRDGAAIDDALTQVYGFDVDGLDVAWRKAIGAAPGTVSAQPTAQPTPTFVPTIVPISGAPLAVTPTPYAVPTSSFSDGSTPSSPTVSSGPPIMLTLLLLGVCCILVILFGLIILGIVVSNKNRKGGKNG